MFYLVKAPRLMQRYYWECLWRVKTDEKKIFLTFDDGPTPEVTNFVLEQLALFNAKATFFCIGKQVEENPETYQRIIEAEHAIGNHSYSHLNGWKTNAKDYLEDIRKAAELIDSKLYRPPYGRVTKFQLYNLINGKNFNLKPVMWHVLSGDFDQRISADQCYLNVIKNAGKGSLIVFHDSKKAFGNLKEALPRVLSFYQDKGYTFEKITESLL